MGKRPQAVQYLKYSRCLREIHDSDLLERYDTSNEPPSEMPYVVSWEEQISSRIDGEKFDYGVRFYFGGDPPKSDTVTFRDSISNL